jgi:hypothetical protein
MWTDSITKLDRDVIRLVSAGCKDDDVVLQINLEYNGIVKDETVKEILESVRLNAAILSKGVGGKK